MSTLKDYLEIRFLRKLDEAQYKLAFLYLAGTVEIVFPLW